MRLYTSSAAIEAAAASQLSRCSQSLAVLCCWMIGGLNAGSGRAADEEAGERESWTPWFATLSLSLCGRVLKDASAEEDMRSVLLRAVRRCIASTTCRVAACRVDADACIVDFCDGHLLLLPLEILKVAMAIATLPACARRCSNLCSCG